MTDRIGKLWKGELRLVESFWLWGVAGTLVLSFGSQFLLTQLIVGGFVSGLLFFNFLLIGLGISYLVLISVGIWRSATRYVGNKFWSWGSRGVVISVIALNAYILSLVAIQSPADTNDPGKDSCNIESYLRPTAERPLIGFWKVACSDNFGIAIDAQQEGLYSVSFCGPGGCFKPGTYRPNTRLIDDPDYRVIDQSTLEVRGLRGFERYSRCSKPLVVASADVQSNPSSHADAPPGGGTPVKACR
jgi:hypothetical protein